MPETRKVKHKRRYCRIPGCGKIVKSQGLCQRHGAKTRKCKIDGCEKQAQGNFDGMCKAHFKLTKTKLIDRTVVPEGDSPPPPPPEGESVYDRILPASIGWTYREGDDSMMPLVKHLKEGFDEMRPRGWHRNAERRARGLFPVTSPAVQLEGWERELVWMEICILSGCPQASFRHLARAWGRDKGFHTVLATFICGRRGDVERKKRTKGETSAVTKKAKRAPMELAPGDEEEPIDQVLGLDDMDMDLDMLGVLDNQDGGAVTVNASSAITMGSCFEREMAASAQGIPELEHIPQAPTHQAVSAVYYAPSKGKRGKRRPLNMGSLTEVDDHTGSTKAPSPGKVIMLDDLICEESVCAPAIQPCRMEATVPV